MKENEEVVLCKLSATAKLILGKSLYHKFSIFNN